MAVYVVLNKRGKYKDGWALRDVIRYAASKANENNVFGGAVLPEIAVESMEGIARAYHKAWGSRLRHSVLSFGEKDGITLRQIRSMIQPIIAYYQSDYQILAVIHEDREHLHVHFIMNSVSYRDGSKYDGKIKDYYAFHNYLTRILHYYGISVKFAKDLTE